MSKMRKTVLTTLTLLVLLCGYFLLTPWGHQRIYTILSHSLNKHSPYRLEIRHLNLLHYPNIEASLRIEEQIDLIIKGQVDKKMVDISYQFKGDRFPSHQGIIEDHIALHGSLKGPWKAFTLQGKGEALEGEIQFDLLGHDDALENLNIQMKDINSTKLQLLLKKEPSFNGEANITMHFPHLSRDHKEGNSTFSLYDLNLSGVPVHLEGKIDTLDQKHHGTLLAHSDAFILKIPKGSYDQSTHHATGFYILNIKDLKALEPLIGYAYYGSFYGMGEVSYDDSLVVTGLSKSFGGMTDYTYAKDQLHIALDEVSFEEVMHLFPYPPFLRATATGTIDYDFKAKQMLVKSDLSNAKVIHKKLINIIYQKAGVNLNQETFTHSKLSATYHDHLIKGDLKLKNKIHHLFLNHTQINTETKRINAYFDFYVQQQAFSGKLYGALDHPQVNLDMQKLIRFQMDKQVDSMIGKENREMMESMPMAPAAKDMATDVGASFMNMFF